MMESTISLVTGGAKSGKSVFAEQLLAGCRGRKAYVATAQVLDEEMASRIACHRERRPASWQTFEIPFGLPQQLDTILDGADAVLIDCMTIYFSNFLFCHEEAELDELKRLALVEVEELLQCIDRRPGKNVIFVTNELGCGLVPMNKVGRYYRDLIGIVNQRLGAAADAVYLTVCGITTEIKGRQIHLPVPSEEA